jgi:hypothetical protein
MQYDSEMSAFMDAPALAVSSLDKLLQHYQEYIKYCKMKLDNNGDNFEKLAEIHITAINDPNDRGKDFVDKYVILAIDHMKFSDPAFSRDSWVNPEMIPNHT